MSITTAISQKYIGNQDPSLSTQTAGEIEAKLFMYIGICINITNKGIVKAR